jgi:hypothetical protein
MPKWFYHRKIADVISVGLSREDMCAIDSILDGVRKDYEHDFWKYDKVALKNSINQIFASYGVDGVKYSLLHIFLDTFQGNLVSEMTRETLSARIARNIAHETAFNDAIFAIEYIKNCIEDYDEIFDRFLLEVRGKRKEIVQLIKGSPEVEAQIRGIEKFKLKNEKARKIAIKYIDTGYDIPFYVSFILELWNDRKRGPMTKEEWAEKTLSKYKDMLMGLRNDVAEKRYNNLLSIAKSLGYIK